MEFFKKFFAGNWHEYDTGELEVLCPFPHTDQHGNQYFETHRSAHINESKSLFHCKVCGKGMSEASFLSKLQGISYKDALVLLKEMGKHEDDWSASEKRFQENEPLKAKWNELGLNLETATDLRIGHEGEGFSFPVYIYGDLLDVRKYRPGKDPKVMSRRGAKKLLLPFDLWRTDERPTLLCAGEKDMAIARQKGFNAITFTGGEQAFPKLFKHSFKGKQIYIAYDNDQAGQEGSRKVASLLKDAGAFPYVVTGHYEVCTEKGEDIHDFFIKYEKTEHDLRAILEHTEPFSEKDHREEQQKYIPLVSITEAMEGQYANRLVASRVSVTATYEEGFHVPDYAELTKTHEGSSHNLMEVGEKKVFTLDEENAKDILYLMDSNLKDSQIDTYLKMLAHIPPKESNITISRKSKIKIHKAVVTDDLESETVQETSEKRSMRELLVYSINEPIEPGHKYKMYYKPVGHPLKGQQIVGIVTRLEESDNSMNRFQVNASVLESLKVFQVKPYENLSTKMNEMYERAKAIIGPHARKEVTWATDLFFHTPLQFFFSNRLIRGYLDTMIIGPERSGKSDSAKYLMQTYELGLITSLKTTTIAGLMGGSDQTSGGWKTKLGLLPRNHQGAIILEEFSGGGQDLVSKLTEVRSSNRVRLSRVNGSIDVPAMVRMLAISNVKKDSDGNTIPIRNYPHGMKIILDLIGTSEDIARYDFILVLDEPNEYISPLTKLDYEPFEKEAYQNRIRWVWSRKPEQIILDPIVSQQIVNAGDDLNAKYNTHIKLFGPEAWKKISRIAVAVAGMVCSMSEDGQNLIVRKEHVDFAKQFLIDCYDNKLFKLREFVESQRHLVECDEEAVHALQGMYSSHPVMLKHLEMSTEINQRDLQMVSGLEPKEAAKIINQLVRCGFVEYGSKIVPTQRFRMAMTKIDKHMFMRRIGER